LLAPLACGQFGQIVITDDGRQIYFTTRLDEKSAPLRPLENRVFRLNDGRLELFSQRGDLAPTNMATNNDGASSLHISGDGRTVAFVQKTLCFSADPCVTATNRAVILGRNAREFADTDRVLLSRNGRWAVIAPPRFSVREPEQPSMENTATTLVDLETGERTAIGRPATVEETFALASDGSVFVLVPRADGGVQPVFWRAGEFRQLRGPLFGPIAFLGISDDASTILAQRLDPPRRPSSTPVAQLVVVDSTGSSHHVGTAGEVGRWILLGMSNDGRRALLASIGPSGPGTAFVADLRNHVLHPLTLPDRERVVAGAMTGFGDAVVVGTTAGRIVRFAMQFDGRPAPTPDELLPVMPYIREFERLLTPGLRMQIADPAPAEIDLRGRIRLDDEPVAILGRSGGMVEVQVPWSLRLGRAMLALNIPTSSPFEQRDRPLVFRSLRDSCRFPQAHVDYSEDG
jgi:hypothetical protein